VATEPNQWPTKTFTDGPPVLRNLGAIPGTTPGADVVCNIVEMRGTKQPGSRQRFQIRIWARNRETGERFPTERGIFFSRDNLPLLIAYATEALRVLESEVRR
jgi:hypothetical protein